MKKVLFFVTPLLLVAIGYWLGQSAGRSGDSFPAIISSAHAQDSQPAEDELLVSPTEARERDVYYPNSESLKPDEMRVIACGTGMPTTRAAQAAACFLVELGNGGPQPRRFFFDLGNGSAGIRVSGVGSDDNTIGGVNPGEGNVIAFNDNDGLQLQNGSGTGNSMLGNSIYSNSLLGIDLHADSVFVLDRNVRLSRETHRDCPTECTGDHQAWDRNGSVDSEARRLCDRRDWQMAPGIGWP